jgi:Tol biopolymer transport system component
MSFGPMGTGLRQLTTTTAHNTSWSPDSKRIVFDDGRDIFTIGVDGKNLRRLTRTAVSSRNESGGDTLKRGLPSGAGFRRTR